MKKLLLVLLPALLLLSACDPGRENVEYKLEIKPAQLTFEGKDAPAQTVTVTAENVEWDVEIPTEYDWIHYETVAEGISVTVDDNTSDGKREGKIIVTSKTAGVDNKEISITQKVVEVEYTLEVDLSELIFEAADAPAQTVTVTAKNVEWDVEIPTEYDWIHYETIAEGISVTVDDNTSDGEREGKLIITSKTDGVENKEVEITQSGVESGDVHIFRNARMNYYEDYYDVGAGNFMLEFFTGDYDEDGYTVGDGYALSLDVLSEMPDDNDHPILASGTYAVQDEKEKFVVIRAKYSPEYEDYSYSIYGEIEDGYLNYDSVCGVYGGELIIEWDGDDGYLMEFNFELSNGTTFKATYEGSLSVDELL